MTTNTKQHLEKSRLWKAKECSDAAKKKWQMQKRRIQTKKKYSCM